MFRKFCQLTKEMILRNPPVISNIWLETTDRCNSRCTNCNKWQQKFTEDILKPSEIYKMFSDPVFKNVKNIINSGGEPTTRADLKRVLVAEHKALPKATLQLSTNGLLPRQVINIVDSLLSEYPDLNMEVGTSLDGIGESHDAIRNMPGNFKKVDYLLSELVKLKEAYGCGRLGVSFGTVLTEKTVDHIHELQEYAKEKGVGMLVQWYNHAPFYSNSEAPIWSPEVKEKMKKIVKELDYTIFSEKWIDWLDGKPIKFNCMALRGYCAIKCNGDIVPCFNHWWISLGNVRKKTPTQILDRTNYGPSLPNAYDVCLDLSVLNCVGCLNSWGLGWSVESDPIQYARYFVRHPLKLVKKLCSEAGA